MSNLTIYERVQRYYDRRFVAYTDNVTQSRFCCVDKYGALPDKFNRLM